MTLEAAVQHVDGMPEPPLRRIDFSQNQVVRQISTTLRRLWLIEPPLPFIEAKAGESSSFQESFHSAFREIGNGIAEDSPETRWDDALWLSRTNHRILNPVAKTFDPENKGYVYSTWRMEIYDLYKHVFFDFSKILKTEPDTEYLGEVKFSKTVPISLWLLAAGRMEIDRRTFGTDTFLYPVWLNPKASLVLSVEDARHIWKENEERSWDVGLWLRESKEISINVEMIATDAIEEELAAVFALGHCEERISISLNKDDGPIVHFGEAPDSPVTVPEADHLARAIFLRAGEAVEHCCFDEMYVGKIQELDDDLAHWNIQGSDNASLYQPLPSGSSIRILVLEAESAGPELRTSLKVVDLNDDPIYEAMSYAWGDPKDKTTLRVWGYKVPIPRNLEDALKRIRYPDRRRYIWADAVCINQEDIPERGQQVSIMREIYLKAERVLVWLGEDQLIQAKTAFTLVCDIVRSWRPQTNRFDFSSYQGAFEPRKSSFKIEEERWVALRAMFEIQYFTRFWVIQELVLGESATIIWGEHHISWGLIGICAAWLLTRGWPVVSGKPLTAAYNAFLIYVLPLAKRSGISSFSKLELSVVLATTMERFLSTDARDRIYALLGLPFSGNDPSKGTLVTPDYSASVQSVYLDATKKMLAHDGHLRLLSAVQHGLEIDDSVYPSWVPQYNGAFFAEPLALSQEHGYYANAGELFFCGKDSFGLDGKSLILSGLECAVVSEVTRLFSKGNMGFSGLSDKDRAAMVSILRYFNDEGKQVRASWSATLEQFRVFGFTDPEVQSRQMIGMTMAATIGKPGKYGMRESNEMLTGEKPGVDNLGEFLLYWRERCSWDINTLKHDDFAAFWEAIERSDDSYIMERALCSMNSFAGRKIFHCGDGKFGLGPAAMKPGDIVVILFGAIVPYILRPLDNGTQQWALVGECFVPGLMQGEAVEAAGMLKEGKFSRDEDGDLTLSPVDPSQEEAKEEDPRFHREVGKNGIQRFEIR